MNVNKKSPFYVGHRGSRGVGVENTIEAFKAGINRGYQALECDVRVSKDNQLIIFHDETLKRLANLEEMITSLSLQELQSITLKQHYQNKVLTGTIPTLEEYLLLCKENNIIPIIELKWSTGINNNDFTNIPLLIELIRQYDLFEKAIILTSMIKVLAHLRSLHQNLQLQLLIGAQTKLDTDTLNFAFDNNISLDVEKSALSEQIVTLAHSRGLQVNCWTVNTDDWLQKMLSYNVDMITTDDLK